ncbi:MAG: VOC family protein [Chloroflexota bacterium]
MTTTTRRLPEATHIGGAHLRVQNLERALGFYRDVLGFNVTENDSKQAALAASAVEAPIFRLTEHSGFIPKPQRSTGLYHVAILMPDRPALARILRRLLVRRYPLGGASDHLVSEALYLSDPDGNGLEIYRDRPRSEWRMNGDQIAMATEPLDADGLLEEAHEQDAGVVAGTTIGHMHLHVSDLTRAEAFYSGLLGFDVVVRGYPGALFVSAGGYHHHLGLNTWAGKMPPPANAVGLEDWTLVIPGEEAWAQAVERTGAVVEGDLASVRDPDGNRLVLAKG